MPEHDDNIGEAMRDATELAVGPLIVSEEAGDAMVVCELIFERPAGRAVAHLVLAVGKVPDEPALAALVEQARERIHDLAQRWGSKLVVAVFDDADLFEAHCAQTERPPAGTALD